MRQTIHNAQLEVWEWKESLYNRMSIPSDIRGIFYNFIDFF